MSENLVEDVPHYREGWGLKDAVLGDGLESLDKGGCLGVPEGPQSIGKVVADSKLHSAKTNYSVSKRGCMIYSTDSKQEHGSRSCGRPEDHVTLFDPY